jgi:hypothetical protein
MFFISSVLGFDQGASSLIQFRQASIENPLLFFSLQGLRWVDIRRALRKIHARARTASAVGANSFISSDRDDPVHEFDFHPGSILPEGETVDLDKRFEERIVNDVFGLIPKLSAQDGRHPRGEPPVELCERISISRSRRGNQTLDVGIGPPTIHTDIIISSAAAIKLLPAIPARWTFRRRAQPCERLKFFGVRKAAISLLRG